MTKWYGILFFPTTPARGIGEQFAIPFFEVSRRRMRAIREFREAITRGDTATVTTQKPFGGLAQKPVMLVLGKPMND
ncbi:MAG: hypothetical protein WAN75_15230 [Xanthobacteraceae bacterium]